MSDKRWVRAVRSEKQRPVEGILFRVGACVVLGLAAPACSYAEEPIEVPDADTQAFVGDVYPILLADCGYPTCHGDPARFFTVYGPGRTRLDPVTDAYAPATTDEVAISYHRARSMLVSPNGPRRSPLLLKPLAVSAGGSSHEGDDPWGQPIFSTKRDLRFEALFFWAIGVEAEP